MTWTNLQGIHAQRQKNGPVAWCEAGQGAPLLLIHGVGLNADAWAPQIHTLSGRHRVITVDLPGHGQSDMLPEGAELADYVAAISNLIDTLGIAPAPVIGHSMGALIALGLAIDYPEKIASIVSLNGVYCRDPLARSAVEIRAAQLTGGAFEAAGPVTRWFPDDPMGPLARQVTDWLHEVDPKAYAAVYRVFATSDHVYDGRLKDVPCRALFMTGVSDPNSTPAMSERMAREVPHGSYAALPGARHMMHLTHPAETTNTIATFVDAAQKAAR